MSAGRARTALLRAMLVAAFVVLAAAVVIKAGG